MSKGKGGKAEYVQQSETGIFEIRGFHQACLLTDQFVAFAQADLLQQLLRMHIQNSEYPADLLEELVCNMMPQVIIRRGDSASDSCNH